MSATRFPRNRSGLYAITASLLLLLPLTAGAAGSTIRVAPPNGLDDTSSIQHALDETAFAYKNAFALLALAEKNYSSH